jgi:transposase InsO family protein
MSTAQISTASPIRSARTVPPRPPSRAEQAKAAVRKQALTHLSQVRDELGYVPGPLMDEVASRLGVHEMHLSRMLRQFRKTERVPQRPGSTYKKTVLNPWKAQVVYFVYHGDATATYNRLAADGELPEGMSLRAFQRRVLEWDPAVRACAKGGYRAMVKEQFFNIEHIPHKAYAYGTDHTKLPIRVLPMRGTTPVWPWLTTLMCLKTRLVLAYKLTAHTPTAEDSIDTLLEGIHGEHTEDGMFIGGKPMFLRSDRGADYVGNALALNLIDLEIEPRFTEPYSSWQNGRVERLNGSLDAQFAPTVPGFHPGGEDQYTRRVLNTPVPESSLLTIETLDRRLGDWFGEYNNKPHRSLGGLTPLEAWAADDHVVAVADNDTVVNAMTPRETRRLHHYGIEARGVIYSHPTLARLRKLSVREVEIRYHDHDRDHIEVFVGGVHECRATRSGVQPEVHRFGVLSSRQAQRRQAEALVRSADYQRVLDEQVRLREEGVDESEWPVLPPNPEDADDFGDAASMAATWAASLDDNGTDPHTETGPVTEGVDTSEDGASPDGTDIYTAWSSRLTEPSSAPDDPSNTNPDKDSAA